MVSGMVLGFFLILKFMPDNMSADRAGNCIQPDCC